MKQKQNQLFEMFRKYHYLSHSLNEKVKNMVFILTLNDIVCAFVQCYCFHTQRKKNFEKNIETVILPDFQGISLGVLFQKCADFEIRKQRINFDKFKPCFLYLHEKTKNGH